MLGVLLVASALSGVGADPDDKKTDQNRLQGTWVARSATSDGRDAPAEVLDKLKFEFQGDKMRMLEPGLDHARRRLFTLGAGPKPKTIDFQTKGAPKDISLGIYELQGDELKVCFSRNPGGARPTTFAAPADSGHTLVVFRRDKAAPVVADKPDAWKEFPKLILGRWKFSSGITEFGRFAPDTEFTPNGKVMQLAEDRKTWVEKYRYRFDKDELILTPVAGPGKGKDITIGILTLTADRLTAEYPDGILKRAQ